MAGYGEVILSTPDGKWYWSHVLMDCSYVPKGNRTRIIPLGYRENSPDAAICKALKAELKARQTRARSAPERQSPDASATVQRGL
ncbi:hypothetical protein GCM10023196_036510 [Actinoallomurus vinaceus]|uniref:Uncharacterized protein n=1 Tax=Actinoallomurus vinaceus TaxID=1080074 RepID=A0ABP8U946_9ACTN